MQIEYLEKYKGHTIKITRDKEGYSSHVHYFSENSKSDERRFKNHYFSCLEEAIEASEAWIDELSTDYY